MSSIHKFEREHSRYLGAVRKQLPGIDDEVRISRRALAPVLSVSQCQTGASAQTADIGDLLRDSSLVPKSLLVTGRFCILTLVAFVCFERASFAEETAVEKVVKNLSSDSFMVRSHAQRELLELAPQNLPELEGFAVTGETETVLRIVEVLESLFLKNDNQLGEQAEKILQQLTTRGGSASISAGLILQGNARLRESRARKALEKVGAQFVYYMPTAHVDGRPLFYSKVAVLPGIGIEFGPPAVLHSIYLHENWTGTKADLWHLTRLENHRDLLIYSIKGNSIEINDLFLLARSLPGLAIQERGACLGIRSESNSDGCVVGKVVVGGSANKGGIIRGDNVLKLDDVQIRNFPHLVLSLQEYKIGDEVTFTISREGVEMELLITLGSWRDVARIDEMTVEPPAFFTGPFGQATSEADLDVAPATKENDSSAETPESPEEE